MTTKRRRGAVLAALILAAVATLSLFSYVRGVEAKAVEGSQSVEAFVAKDVIPAGTTGQDAITQGLVVRQPIPRRVIPDSAIHALSEIQGKVAAVSILKGEQILSDRFVPPTQNQGASGLAIPADRQAMTIQVANPPGVGGFIQPASRVSVIVKVDAPQPQVQFLLQDIQVLAVGQRVATPIAAKSPDPKATPTSGGIGAQAGDQQVVVTLAVTPVEAEKLAYGVMSGQIYLTLVPPDQKPQTTPGRTPGNLFS